MWYNLFLYTVDFTESYRYNSGTSFQEGATVFIKTTKAKAYEYIKLVESYRDENNITRHKVLFNFGRSDLIKDDKSFIRMVKKLCEITEIGIAEAPKLDCGEAEMLRYGYLPYLKLWHDLGIANCLTRLDEQAKNTYQTEETAFLMAVQRLLEPGSKLAAYLRQDQYIGIKQAELQHLYRTLDRLGANKDRIENELFAENYTKVGNKVDVVFYDVTTFAFESVVADELRNFGFSKDCKFNEVQVVMGLLIDSNGFPIGYELFPGNTFDGKTMLNALGNVQKRFGINKVVIVADRGLNSKTNLQLIKDAGYGYIVASKIKSMKAETIKKILDPAGYEETSAGFKYKTMEYINFFKDEDGNLQKLPENLIVSYSEKRAGKDRADRQRLIDKARKLLENPSSIKSSNKRGGKKYINADGKTSYNLNNAAIEKDSRFDGYYGIQTSEKEMSADQITEAYHTLWKIEESFRIVKSSLEVRPVFHWKPERIHGHFMVCFLAFMMERRLETLLNEAGIENSPETIKEALNAMLLAKVTLNGEETYIKAKNKPLATRICGLLKIALPQNINTKLQIDELCIIGRKNPWGQLALF